MSELIHAHDQTTKRRVAHWSTANWFMLLSGSCCEAHRFVDSQELLRAHSAEEGEGAHPWIANW